ncbi:MAG: YfcE family phosphodiesterase [Deltaproteobacteria bacterium]|nr:YfcE family phosphodiesterase [Deltaproteobacteria bacterium]
MLLGIVSDTHANLAAIQEVGRCFQAAAVDQVLHLGDDYLDTLFFEAVQLKVLGVPGLYCPEYRDPQIPNRRIEILLGVKILMTHTREASRFDQPGDLDPAKAAAEVDIVLFGHTHVPQITEKKGVLWVNPGHLKAHDGRGYPHSYALMHLAPPRVDVKIVALAGGKTLLEGVFTLQR